MNDEQMTGRNALLDGKDVAIVGGGPGGLTLARLLQRRGARVCVYERDASPLARQQGGCLDLHEQSGQLALREAGLMERFHGIARSEGQHAKIFDRDGIERFELRAEDEAQSCPEIDRGELRTLLLDSLEPGTVQWDCHLTEVVRCDRPGEHRLVFASGDSARADLVVGCDGTGSKVRPLVTLVKPAYGGVTFIETCVSEPDVRYPALSARVGPGSIMVVGDNRGLLAQRNGDGRIRVYVALRVPEAWPTESGIDFARAAATRERLLDCFAGWSPGALELLRLSDDVFMHRPLYTVPANAWWREWNDARAGVTLLGDAAHVMPPFTGQGANLAMLDAVELARALTDGAHASLTDALRAYEHAMFERMTPAIDETLASQDLVIAADAPQGLIAAIRERMRG